MNYRPNNFSEGETNRLAAAEIQKLREKVKTLEQRNNDLYGRTLEILKELLK